MLTHELFTRNRSDVFGTSLVNRFFVARLCKVSDCGVGVVAWKVCFGISTLCDISVAIYAVLRRSMVTVSFLPSMSRIKTFRFLLRMLRGPLYGGTNGLLTVSVGIHTWVQVCRSQCWKDGRFVCHVKAGRI